MNKLKKAKRKIKELKITIDVLDERIAELEDFAIWLTGCGYDFCKHEYFIKKRDELLKGG